MQQHRFWLLYVRFSFIRVLIFSITLYHSLFIHLLRKYLEELFFATKHFKSSLNRSIVYLFLISSPMIILTFISLFYNQSLVGLETSMTIDEINILAVTGYICWLEESRHTPIRGMHLIRDILFAITYIALYVEEFHSGTLGIQQPTAVLGIAFVYYIVLSYFEGIEEFLMKVLGLKQSNRFNAKFLLTSKYNIPDFLEIKDIIHEKKESIEQELTDYRQILINLQENQEDQQILMNFAKIFLPIKKAYEIKEQLDNNEALKEIETTWSQGSAHSSDQQHNDEQPIHNSPTWNESSDGLGFYLKSTYTDDFINEDEHKDEQLSFYDKFLKYFFYPVYLASLAQGRLFYFVGYLSIGLLLGCMFGISNATVYFSSIMDSLTVITTVVAALLIYPSAKYCIQISSNNDYDFTNMFLQSMILKLIITSVYFICYTQFYGTTIYINKGAFIFLIARLALLGVYLVFMVLNRFAARFNNFKYFCGFLVVSWVSQVIGENVYNNMG